MLIIKEKMLKLAEHRNQTTKSIFPLKQTDLCIKVQNTLYGVVILFVMMVYKIQ